MSDRPTPNPCPFCGHKARILGNGDESAAWVACGHCYAGGPNAETRDEAVRVWNEFTAAPARAQALTAQVDRFVAAAAVLGQVVEVRDALLEAQVPRSSDSWIERVIADAEDARDGSDGGNMYDALRDLIDVARGLVARVRDLENEVDTLRYLDDEAQIGVDAQTAELRQAQAEVRRLTAELAASQAQVAQYRALDQVVNILRRAERAEAERDAARAEVRRLTDEVSRLTVERGLAWEQAAQDRAELQGVYADLAASQAREQTATYARQQEAQRQGEALYNQAIEDRDKARGSLGALLQWLELDTDRAPADAYTPDELASIARNLVGERQMYLDALRAVTHAPTPEAQRVAIDEARSLTGRYSDWRPSDDEVTHG